MKFEDGSYITKTLGLASDSISDHHLLTSLEISYCSIKTITVPKLLARPMDEIDSLKILNGRYYCWCDSTVALSWIRDEPSIFNVFVANRIASI